MILVCCAALGISACRETAPTGQVVAIMNGEEITVGELRSEAAAREPQNSDNIARSELFRDLLNRKLWAQEAKRGKLDRQIEFVLAKRRAEESLLADLQIRTLSNAVEHPSDSEIDRFFEKNPTAFSSRTIFEIDQINVRPEGNTLFAESLSKADSLDEIDQMLTSFGIVGQRSRTEWNSLFMPTSLAEKLRRLPPLKLFFQRNSDILIAATVVSKTDVPLSMLNRKILARQRLRERMVNAAIVERTDELRASAKIQYQPDLTFTDAAR